jgi:hypothetical protein
VRRATLLLAAHALTACYTFQPVAGPAPLNRDVALEITDLGRARLGSSLGPFPLRLEGRLTAVTDTSYSMAVRSVESIRGGTAPWAGEVITLRSSDVSIVRRKQLNRTRTSLGSAIAVGAVVAFFVTRSLLVNGSEGEGGTPRPPGGGTPGT